jgi:hypothetical protein
MVILKVCTLLPFRRKSKLKRPKGRMKQIKKGKED